MNKSSVLIVGGGPAGSATAYFLAKNGIDVVLLDKDKWPRDKVCGGGLTANSLPILRQMGLIDEIDEKADFKFSGYTIYSSEGKAISAPVQNTPYSYVIRRDYFDQMLLDKAREAGAKIFTEVEVANVDISGTVTVNAKGGDIYTADILVVADGSGGSVTRQLSKGVHKGSVIAIRGYYSGVRETGKDLEFFIDDEIGFGYGWLFPMGKDMANVGVGIDSAYLKRRKKNIRQVFKEMLQKPPLGDRMANAKIEGKLEAFPLRMGFEKGAFRQGQVLFVGDSAKLVYPLSGEGIAYALQSAKHAADAIKSNNLAMYDVWCCSGFGDFKHASRLQKLLSWPRAKKFFFMNAVYDKAMAQKVIGVLEHSQDVSTFLNIPNILRNFVISAKRKIM